MKQNINELFRGKLFFPLVWALLLVNLTCACARKKAYHDDVVRPIGGLVYGTVVNVSLVRVTDLPSYAGPLAGATAGGVAGYILSGPKGAVIGAGIGSLAAGEEFPKTLKATELTVELEDGAFMLILVGNDEYFVRGDEVRIVALEKHFVRVQHK